NSNYMLKLVNAERQKNNLPAAQKHTDYMARIKMLTHKENLDIGARIKAQGYDWTLCGENIASGQKNEDEVMKTWMNSPLHRQNILNKGFKNLGVGYSSNGNYWTQDFGTTKK
ncbi:6040_t:CDS:2, partial [Scutellospora calospora]